MKALSRKDSLKEMFYYCVDNKHNWKYFIFWAKTICSGLDRAQGEAQADQGGHH